MEFVVFVLTLGVFLLWNAVALLKRRVQALEARIEWDREPKAPAAQRPAASEVKPATATVVGAAAAAAAATATDAAATPPVDPAGDPTDQAGPGDADRTWEVTVGASWFNKIGVLVIVMSMALAAGYSMTTVGPFGRVVLGYLASAALLVAGITLERKPSFRNYGYGLVAGGWAGTYFITYAMRAVPATQVLTSDVTATMALAVVAAGMIGHAQRYRSQTVTGLTYVVAFVTLAMTPLRMFSLVATLPLSVTLLLTAQRFGWARMSVLGVAATYAIYTLRTHAQTPALDPLAATPYLLLAAYWLTFEIADILGQQRRAPDAPAAAPLFALNAAGYLVAGLTQMPDDPTLPVATAFLAGSAGAFAASALARLRWLPSSQTGPEAGGRFTSTHGAVMLATLLALWTVDLQFADTRETYGLLLMTELVFAAGLALRDGHVRQIACVAAMVTTLHLLTASGIATIVDGAIMLPEGWTLTLALVAGAWYAHREWLRYRSITPAPLEHLYSWTATWLLVVLVVREFANPFEPLFCGLAFVGLAAALIEAGLRHRPEYRYQGYVTGAVGVLWIAAVAIADASGSVTKTATVLALASAACYALAWRLASRLNTAGRWGRIAAGAAATSGTLLLALLEREVLPAEMIGPAWALTGALMALSPLLRDVPLFRWHAWALLTVAPVHAFRPIPAAGDATSSQIAGLLVTLAIAYGVALYRKAADAPARGLDFETPEGGARVLVTTAATLQLTTLIGLEASNNAITLLWGLQGVALLMAGFGVHARVIRLSGLALLVLCIGKLFVYDLSELEGLARIFSFAGLGVALLGVSGLYNWVQQRSGSR